MQQCAHPVVIIDLNLPGAGGMDLLRSLREQWPGTQAVILTGFGDLNAARQAIDLDAADFLTKPWRRSAIWRLLSARPFRRLRHELPSGPVPEYDGFDDEESLDGERMARYQVPALPSNSRRGKATPGCRWKRWRDRRFLPSSNDTAEVCAAAASQLGISIRKLYYRLAQYQNQPRTK